MNQGTSQFRLLRDIVNQFYRLLWARIKSKTFYGSGSLVMGAKNGYERKD